MAGFTLYFPLHLSALMLRCYAYGHPSCDGVNAILVASIPGRRREDVSGETTNNKSTRTPAEAQDRQLFRFPRELKHQVQTSVYQAHVSGCHTTNTIRYSNPSIKTGTSERQPTLTAR
jgi:hypothetical protein